MLPQKFQLNCVSDLEKILKYLCNLLLCKYNTIFQYGPFLTPTITIFINSIYMYTTWGSLYKRLSFPEKRFFLDMPTNVKNFLFHSLKEGMTLHLNKCESPLPKDPSLYHG